MPHKFWNEYKRSMKFIITLSNCSESNNNFVEDLVVHQSRTSIEINAHRIIDSVCDVLTWKETSWSRQSDINISWNMCIVTISMDRLLTAVRSRHYFLFAFASEKYSLNLYRWNGERKNLLKKKASGEANSKLKYRINVHKSLRCSAQIQPNRMVNIRWTLSAFFFQMLKMGHTIHSRKNDYLFCNVQWPGNSNEGTISMIYTMARYGSLKRCTKCK